MKTDISIPNPIFHASEKLARKMGISLSDLYTAALIAYVTEHQKGQITDTLRPHLCPGTVHSGAGTGENAGGSNWKRAVVIRRGEIWWA